MSKEVRRLQACSWPCMEHDEHIILPVNDALEEWIEKAADAEHLREQQILRAKERDQL